MQKNYDSNIQLDKFLQKISNINDSKVGIIYGLDKEETNETIAKSISLVSSQEKADWKLIKNVDRANCVQDLQDVLLENIQPGNLGNATRKGTISFRKKAWTWYVRRKIDKLRNLRIENNFDPSKNTGGRTRTILWTIVSALSSLGLAMGIPLFSLLLYRQTQITDNPMLGRSFFVGFLVFSIVLIVMAILGTVVSLLNNLLNQKKEHSWQNVDKLYARLIRRYFVNGDASNSPWKFALKKRHFFFYADLSPEKANYKEVINIFKIFRLTGSVVVCSLAHDYKFDLEQVTQASGLDSTRYELFKLNEYKNNVSSQAILDFVFAQTKAIANVDVENLMANNSLFINAVYRFVDFSENNLQALQFCEQLKNFMGQEDNRIGDLEIDYFVDLFVLSALSGVDKGLFNQLTNDIIEYGVPSPETKASFYYQQFQIDFLLNQNLLRYKDLSILFKMDDFMRNGLTLGTMLANSEFHVEEQTPNPFTVLQEISVVLAKRGYSCVDNNLPYYDARMASAYKEYIYVRDINNAVNEEHLPPMDIIHKSLELAQENKINNLVLTLYGEKQFYQFYNGKFKLLLSVFN